jgi:LacI family transcriptional regulator
MAVTLHDIARKSGVSVSTVSRILNKKSTKYRISKQTEKLVEKAAKDLDYRPNQLAQGLRLKKSHTIGLVVPDISNPFFASIVRSMQNHAYRTGYSCLVCDTEESLSLEVEHTGLLRNKGVDGLIVMPVGQSCDHLSSLLKYGVPLVIADRAFENLKVDTVVVDNYAGSYEAVSHLVEHGHARIAIIQGLPDTYTATERLRGYEDALTHRGFPLDDRLIVGKDFRQENGYTQTKLLLKLELPPTAIFSTSDLITLGALQAIYEEGLKIPDDISIIAFDDVEGAEYFRCPITVVAQPKEAMGETAVRLLVDQLLAQNKIEPKRVLLKPRLVIRGSVACASKPSTADVNMG